MGALMRFISSFSSQTNSHYSKYIFYKIVDYVSSENKFVLQCINTKAVFRSDLKNIVFDIDILYGLHPIQSSYIGLEYSKIVKQVDSQKPLTKKQEQKINNYPMSRYGKFLIQYQDRKGNIAFVDSKTNEEFLMDARDIVLSKEIIQEFDASQAFYIGLQAGLKLASPQDDSFKARYYFKLVE